MNCKEAESLMVMFSTLTPDEKIILKGHLENCSSCTAYFTSIQKQEELIRQAKTWIPELNDPAAFTDQIMEALPPRQSIPTTKRHWLSGLFNWTPLQTGLAACSLILAFTFAVEFYQIEQPMQPQNSIKNGVMLSSNQEKLIQAKRNRVASFSLEKMIRQENTLSFQSN